MIEAIAWAFRQDIKPSSVKFVLVALGNFANDEGEAYPSIESICRRTSQDRKTVILALNQLVSNGLIKDTGRRKGSTQRVKVYQFTVPKAELLNGSKFPRKQSRNSAETVPDFPINGSENGTQIHQGSVSGNQKEEPPPTVPRVGQASESDEIYEFAEAKRLICELVFRGEKKPSAAWSHEAEHALSRLLPLSLCEIKLVAWFHGLEADDAVQELRVRRQSETTLLKNWSDEVTRARKFRKKRGAVDADAPAKKEPVGWREFYRWYHENADIILPDSFWKLPTSQRADYDRDFAKFSQERDAVAALP